MDMDNGWGLKYGGIDDELSKLPFTPIRELLLLRIIQADHLGTTTGITFRSKVDEILQFLRHGANPGYIFQNGYHAFANILIQLFVLEQDHLSIHFNGLQGIVDFMIRGDCHLIDNLNRL